MFRRAILLSFFLAILSLGIAAAAPSSVRADTADDLQAQIDDHNQKIKAIQDEIASYQKTLNAVSAQKQTLQTAVKSIDVSRQQTASQINLTTTQISKTNLTLNQLAYQIKDTEDVIALDQKTLAASVREMAASGESSLIEQLFAADTLTDAWKAVDDAAALNLALRQNSAKLGDAKVTLTTQKQDVSAKKDDLTTLNASLAAQKKSLDIARAEKDKLLTQTKSQESTYQSLIATKKAQEQAFEAQLTSLESQLKSVGQSSIPTVGKGILAWPYSPTFAQHCIGISGSLGNNFCVTQYFGNTAFAASGAYSGKGHNGIDIGMPIGTPVQAALAGTVIGTGNTDTAHSASGAQCYSFGKWVMVQHANGLDTLYAHLSQIGVTPGQALATGELVGYSGMTGYATGPHLHFGVYASAGVQIKPLSQFTGAVTPCANATMPVAPLNAYLNPMSYL